jgi:caffeoyl-CoA O-methyltransferase
LETSMRAAPDQARTLDFTPALYDYLTTQTSLPADDVLLDLVAQTNALLPEHAHMVVPAEEGALLTLLVQLLAPQLVVEIGTFTGYSSICLARGLDTAARLLTFDVSDEWTSIARQYWQRAGVDGRIELVLGPAVQTLPSRLNGTAVDLVFIDADKPGYIDYWNAVIPTMRPGGLIVADNTLFGGQVLDPEPGSKAASIRAFNAHVLADPRVESVLLPVGDGLTLARKRTDSVSG